MSFRHKDRVNHTKCLLKLKEENFGYNLQWSIKAHTSPYECGRRKYDLCLTEKTIIAKSDSNKMLKN